MEIKEVTETSRGYTLNPYNVVSTEITGKVDGNGPYDNIKVQIILPIDVNKEDQFCNENGCKLIKNNAHL